MVIMWEGENAGVNGPLGPEQTCWHGGFNYPSFHKCHGCKSGEVFSRVESGEVFKAMTLFPGVEGNCG